MTEIVFIDARVQDFELLLAGLEPGLQVVLLDPTQDGVAQIALALSGVTGLDAVHIVSHGGQGALYLGNAVLDSESAQRYANELGAVGAALGEAGDLLLYGCDVGSGEAGQAFIDQLAALTGADVAASVDATGSAALGGNWTLEASSGLVLSEVFATTQAREAYALTLDTITGTTGNDSLTGTAVNDTLNGLAGNDTLNGLGGIDSLTGGTGSDVFILAAGYGVDRIADFALGDAIRITGLAPTLPVTAGDGSTLVQNQVQLSSSGGVTTLFAGLDASAGADLSLQLTGTFSAGQFWVAGSDIVLNQAPVVTSGATGTVAENAAISTLVYTATATDGNAGTVLAYSLSGLDAALFNINASSGELRLNASANFEAKASYSLNVVASDGGLSTPRAVTINVTNVNEAPVFSSGATGTVAENAAARTVVYAAAAADPEGSNLTYSLSGTDAALLSIKSKTGAVTLQTSANFEAKASYSFNVVASAGGQSTSNAVVVNVTNVNEAPVISSGANGTVLENAAISTAVYTTLASDVDAGTALVYSLTGTDAALLSINSASGVVTLLASADYEADNTYRFNVIASDGALSASKAITVNVTNVNDAPVVTSGATGTVAENAAISTIVYTGSATDQDQGTTLVYSLSGADAALFNINSGSGVVRLSASANFEAKPSYSLNLVASDGSLSSSKAIVVNVTNVNEAPTITSGATGAVLENAAISTVIYSTVGSDVDAGTTLVYSLSGTDAALLNINGGSGAVTLKAPANFEAKTSYSFNVVASDGILSASKSIVVNVSNVNEAPSVTSGATGTVSENAAASTLVYTVTGSDVDAGTTLVYSLSGADAALFNIDSGSGQVRLNASADFEAKPSYSLNVVAGDGSLGTPKAVTISVTDVNEAPSISSGASGSVAENAAISSVVYAAAASDPEGTTLVYSLTGTDAALLSIDSGSGAVTLNAPANFESKASYSFSVVASDGTLSDSQAVTVSVVNLNEAPSISSGATGSVLENVAASTVVYTVTGSDVDAGTILAFSLSGADAALFNIDSGSGVVRLNASANFEAKSSYSLNVDASDGALSASQAVTISVTDVNDAPVITSSAIGSIADATPAASVIYTVAASDEDADTLSYSLAGTDAALLSIDSVSGAVSLDAEADFATKPSYSFDVIASDGVLNQVKAVVINVIDPTDPNLPPQITSGSTGSVAENAGTATVVYTVSATDPDVGAVLSYSLSGTDAALFDIDIDSASGEVTLLAPADFEADASYSLIVEVSDGSLIDSQAVTINVTNVNEAPAVTSGLTGAVAENASTSTVVYQAAGSDVDAGTTLVYSVSGTDAALFNINSGTGQLRLNASANFEAKASYSLNVVASDGSLSDSKAITVNVGNVNEAPSITSGASGSVAENAASSTVVYSAGAADPDAGTTLVYSLSGTDAALFEIDSGNGEVRLQAPANFEVKTSYSLNVIASDGSLSDSQAVTVNVSNVNEAPLVTSGATGTVAENAAASTLVYTVTASDVDAATTLSYSLAGTDAALFSINAGNGQVKLLASANYEAKASYSLNVVASDGSLSASQAITVNVSNVNEAPVVTSGATGSVAENAAIGSVVYIAVGSDVDAATILSYSITGSDAALFAIDSASGALTLLAPANFEAKSSYSLNVVASDGTLSASKAITVNVSNVNEAPGITSGATGSVAENAAIGSVVYQALGSDVDAGTTLAYSVTGTDAALFNINSTSGALTLKAPANFEAKSSYSLNVVASDGTLSDSKAITVNVSDVNEAPIITSGTSGSVAENAAINTVLYSATADDVDVATTLSYSLTGTDAALFAINSSNGALTLLASANFEAKASYSLNVVASDGTLSASQAITIDVTDVNEAPVIVSGATGSVLENAPISTVVYTAVGSDVDVSTTLSYSVTGTDAALFDIDVDTGALTLLAPADFEVKPSYSLNVVASDGALSASKAITINVISVADPNQPPVFTSGSSGAVAENAAINTVVYAATATDPDAGATLTYSLSGSDAALLDINAASGAVTLKASANFEAKASYSFNVDVSDGSLGASKAVSVSVSNVNEAPSVTSGAGASVAENAAIGTVIYTATGSDVDAGTTLAYSLGGTDAALFNINSTSGALTLKAAADFETKASYSLNVVASDGTLSTAKAIAVNVTDVNEAPSIDSGTSGSVAENAAIGAAVYTALATDADAASTITYGVTGADAALFDIGASSGALTLKAPANFEAKASYSLNVVASDGVLNSSKAITVNVTNVNEAPTITSAASGGVAENSATSVVVYTTVGSDVDAGTTLAYSLSGTDAALFSINSASGAVRLLAPANFEAKASYSINVLTSDGSLSASKAVTINVADVNEAPVLTSVNIGSVLENSPIATVVYTAAAVDADAGSVIVYSVTGTDAALFDIDGASGELTLKAPADFETKASYSLDVVASDGALSASKAITITVVSQTDPNQAPVITSGSTGGVAENASIATVIYSATASDADVGDTLTYSLSGADAGLLNVNSGNGAVTLKIPANFEAKASYSFNVEVSDGTLSDSQAISVNVTNVNEAPSITSGATGAVLENAAISTVVYTAVATDVDAGTTLVYSLSGTDAALFAIDSASGVLTLLAPADFEAKASYSLNVVASDGVLSASKAVTVNVIDVNEGQFIDGTAGPDSLVGGSGVDTINGLAGNDTLDGAAGNDSMTGGTGDDLYVVDSTLDKALELAGEGNDLIRSSASYTLGANVENLRLTGAGAKNGTGNIYHNVIFPSDGNNVINGGAGVDTASYLFASSAVSLGLGAGAQNTGGSGTDSLIGIENLTGSNFNDTLNGSAGANQLDGGVGADSMTGGDSADTYIVDNAGDSVVESNAGLTGGVDTVQFSLAAYTLGSNVENARILSAGAASATGNTLNNTLYAGVGDNTLDGGAGIDTASYQYASGAVSISVTSAAQSVAGSGIDTFIGIENITGSAFDDTLTGNAGANMLDGGAGVDSMIGGDGADVYYVRNAGDLVSETNALSAGGNDTVLAYYGGYVLTTNVEIGRIMVSGAAAIAGNTLNNTLQSGTGDNTLTGGLGQDTASYLYASGAVTASLAIAGAQATGGSGSDTFIGIENLTGGEFNDTLIGNAAANVLDGGVGGSDSMTGGDGSDTYLVRDATDSVIETNSALAGGSDLVWSFLSAYTLGSNVENGRIMATGAADITGNALNNVLYAGVGNNILSAGAGVDTVSYAYMGAAVTASLATETATGGSGSDSFNGFENLTGSNFNDNLTGDAAANLLDGGLGVDTMTGGDGNDSYFIRNLGDSAIEASSATSGTLDLAYVYYGGYTLAANIENGRIMAVLAAAINGNSLNNLLIAGINNNAINGGLGNDTVSYLFASAAVNASLATGLATGGSGNDSFVSIDNLTGSNFNDTLVGDGNGNLLTGGLGADSLSGAAGADMFDYNAEAESGISNTTWDRILDFQTLQGDKIDLSGIDASTAIAGNQGFQALSSGAAFNSATTFTLAQRLFYDTTAHVLYGNTDADAAAEFAIELVGVTSLALTDVVA